MKKLREFLFYKRTIEKNKTRLKRQHDLDIDWVYRLYKVYTFSTEDSENIKLYGEKYAETIIKNELKKIDQTIIDLKLYEFIGLYEIKTFPDIKSVGLVFGFKGFNTAKWASFLLWVSALLAFLVGGGLILSKIGLLIGGGAWLLTFLITRLFLYFKD